MASITTLRGRAVSITTTRMLVVVMVPGHTGVVGPRVAATRRRPRVPVVRIAAVASVVMVSSWNLAKHFKL